MTSCDRCGDHVDHIDRIRMGRHHKTIGCQLKSAARQLGAERKARQDTEDKLDAERKARQGAEGKLEEVGRECERLRTELANAHAEANAAHAEALALGKKASQLEEERISLMHDLGFQRGRVSDQTKLQQRFDRLSDRLESAIADKAMMADELSRARQVNTHISNNINIVLASPSEFERFVDSAMLGRVVDALGKVNGISNISGVIEALQPPGLEVAVLLHGLHHGLWRAQAWCS